MRLLRLKVANFRQYADEQDIEFAADDVRNVTVVHGINGAGKTSLFYALNWAFFGDAVVDDNARLVSKATLTDVAPGERFVTSVQVEFEHNGAKYVGVRSIDVEKRSPEPSDFHTDAPTFSLTRTGPDGRSREVRAPREELNGILPESVRSYFFFDGERIDQFARPENAAQVKTAVMSVLRVELLDQAIRHLRATASSYEEELKRHVAGTPLADLIEKRRQVVERLQKSQQEVDDLEAEIKAADRRIATIEDDLALFAESRPLIARKGELDGTITELERERAQLFARLGVAIQRGAFLAAAPAVDQAMQLLEEKREKGQIPSGIRETLVEDLLAQERCICGRSLAEGEPAREQILSLKQGLFSQRLEDAVMAAAARLRLAANQRGEVADALRELLAEEASLHDSLHESIEERSEIEKQLGQIKEDEIEGLMAKRADHRKKQQDLIGRRGAALQRVATLEEEAEDLQKHIAKAEVSETRASDIQRRLDLTRRSELAVKRARAEFADEMRAHIQEEARAIFRRLIWKDAQWQDIRLDDDYQLDVIDRFGFPALADLSAGERQVLSLAFIVGMAEIAEQAVGAEAPLVMDTPFGRLSTQHRLNIIKEIPTLTRQLVLFVTDEELRKETRGELEPKIGAEYHLEFDQLTGTTTIEATV
jgi:DNA sulfur modification protein DndD